MRIDTDFKVGDIVFIRDWEFMENDFGRSDWGGINCIGCFTQDMEHLCGKHAMITKITGKYVELDFEDKNIYTKFAFSTDMICKTTSSLKTKHDFTKDMLKTGMKVLTREGDLYMVVKDCDTFNGHEDYLFINLNTKGFLVGSCYKENLEDSEGEREFDIMEVYNTNQYGFFDRRVLDPDAKYSIWKREEDKVENNKKNNKCESCDNCHCNDNNNDDNDDNDNDGILDDCDLLEILLDLIFD